MRLSSLWMNLVTELRGDGGGVMKTSSPGLIVTALCRRIDNLTDGIDADIHQVSPPTKVTHRHIEFTNAWDFEEVYSALWGFAAS